MKTKAPRAPRPQKPIDDTDQPGWAKAMGLNVPQELAHHRRWRLQLVAQCGTDDIGVLAEKVKRIQTIKCGRCGKGCECIAVGPDHHVTANHVCEPLPLHGEHTFTLRLG